MNKEQFMDVMDGIGDDLIENFLDIPGERIPKRVKKNAARSLIERPANKNGKYSTTKRKFGLHPLIIAAIVVPTVIAGAASIVRYGGFLFEKGNMADIDYFVMITENANDAPATIEKLCYDENLPEKYKVLEDMCTKSDEGVQMWYIDSEADSYSLLSTLQQTKSSFLQPFPAEDERSFVEIKGYSGIAIVHIDDIDNEKKVVTNSVIWDCGEYIHEVFGVGISMDEIMSIVDGMTENSQSVIEP